MNSGAAGLLPSGEQAMACDTLPAYRRTLPGRDTPLPDRHAGKLPTLLDMLRFYAATFLGLFSELQFLEATWYLEGGEEQREKLMHTLEQVAKTCEEIHLAGPTKQARRILTNLERGATEEHVSALTMDLRAAIQEELGARYLFQVLPVETHYYTGGFFEREIFDALPGARFDLEEAGKCFALGRYTATVFHLMRALEMGMARLLQKLGGKMPQVRGWTGLIRACENAGAGRDIVRHLRALKEVWRNATMHVERRYGQEEADEVLAATRAFLRDIVRRIEGTQP